MALWLYIIETAVAALGVYMTLSPPGRNAKWTRHSIVGLFILLWIAGGIVIWKQQNDAKLDQTRAQLDAADLRAAIRKSENAAMAAQGEAASAKRDLALQIAKSQAKLSSDIGFVGRHLTAPVRTLTEDQQQQLVSSLSKVPEAQIVVRFPVGDSEAYEFALLLNRVFSLSGWKTAKVTGDIFLGVPRGLILVVHSQEGAPPYAGLVQRVLKEVGYDASGLADSSVPTGYLKLIVGSRP